MKVAIVHDDLVQWGGAERVLEGICEIFPESPIFTSVFNKESKELNTRFGSKKVITSFLQQIPGWQKMYKTLLPLYPIAFEQFNFDKFDLVISHTTRFAKSIITKPQTKHICYCHTPPRFLWHLSGESSNGIIELLLNPLRIYDQISARRVDQFLAGSYNAQKRIKKIYHQDSKVIQPFIDLERFKGKCTFDGGYFVSLARLNKYKRMDLAVQACLELQVPLKVIGTGPEEEKLKELVGENNKIEFLSKLDDETVVAVLVGAKALIIPGVEDFGLTSLEAQALGKPVIAFKDGGVLETVIDGETGIFFSQPKADSLKAALKKLTKKRIDPDSCRQNAAQFSKDRFLIDFKQIIASLVYTSK